MQLFGIGKEEVNYDNIFCFSAIISRLYHLLGALLSLHIAQNLEYLIGV